MKEPQLTYITNRVCEGDFQLECRFTDGQKFAAITVDENFPELADLVCRLLNTHVYNLARNKS